MGGECSYVVLVAGGLEWLACELISARLGVPVQRILQPPPSSQWSVPPPSPPDLIFAGEAGCAKLQFSLPRPETREGWAAQHAAVASLPYICGLLAPLATAHGISLEAAKGLQDCRAAMAAVPAATWDAAVLQWRHLRAAPPDPSAIGGGSSIEGLSFRGSALRDGKHGFESPQLAEAVGGAVGRRFPGLRVDLHHFDLEVVSILLQGELLIGLNLWRGEKQSFRARMCPEPRPFLPFSDCGAALRPSTAALMLSLAKVQPGDVVLDPMCGIGTVPLVAAAYTSCGLALGGDVDEHVLLQAGKNGQVLEQARRAAEARGAPDLSFGPWVEGAPHMHAWHDHERRVPTRRHAGGGDKGGGEGGVGGGGGPAQAVLWSAAELPLRDRCVDCAAVDLPFGMTHKVAGGKKGLRALYALAFAELARVMRTDGRLVALSTSKPALLEPMERLRGCAAAAVTGPTEGPTGQTQEAAVPLLWELCEERHVNCGGGLAWILVWRRTATPLPDNYAQVLRMPQKVPKVRMGEGELRQREVRRLGRESVAAAKREAQAQAKGGQAMASGGPASGGHAQAIEEEEQAQRSSAPPETPPPPPHPLPPHGGVGGMGGSDLLWLGLAALAVALAVGAWATAAAVHHRQGPGLRRL